MLAGAAPPPLIEVSELTKARLCVLAPTDSSQGEFAGEPTVSGRGPSFPAEAATKMPASRAPRNPSESLSPHGLEGPPPIE
jgi:hypothetical protein